MVVEYLYIQTKNLILMNKALACFIENHLGVNMFINNLNEEQKYAVVTLMHRVAQADGRIDIAETQMLNEIVAGLGIKEVDSETSTSELVSRFDTQKTKVSAILELLAMAHADGEFVATEHHYIREIAGEMDISDLELAIYNSWVIRQVGLLHEAEGFWGGE